MVLYTRSKFKSNHYTGILCDIHCNAFNVWCPSFTIISYRLKSFSGSNGKHTYCYRYFGSSYTQVHIQVSLSQILRHCSSFNTHSNIATIAIEENTQKGTKGQCLTDFLIFTWIDILFLSGTSRTDQLAL